MARPKKSQGVEQPTQAFRDAVAGVYFNRRGSSPGHVIDTALDDLLVLVATLEEAPEGFANENVIRQMLEIHDVIELAQKEMARQTKKGADEAHPRGRARDDSADSDDTLSHAAEE